MQIGITVQGRKEVEQYLNKISNEIPKASEDILKEVAEFGFNYAQNLAPYYTGALRSAMMFFPENKQSWVILSAPSPSDDMYPINVLFDTGEYEKVTGNAPRDKETLFFMQKTAEMLEKEFAERLNLTIKRIIK